MQVGYATILDMAEPAQEAVEADKVIGVGREKLGGILNAVW